MTEQHVCPFWVGYLLASPVRKLFQNPTKLLSPYIRCGMTVLDVGSAMGYFSIPMAKMVGVEGRIVCVDLQQKMLDVLMKRARRAKVAERIIPHKCISDSLGIEEYDDTFDFALASAVVHEVLSPEVFFGEVYAALKPGGLMFVTEPTGHVSAEAFDLTVTVAVAAGFIDAGRSTFSHYYAVELRKD